MVRRSRKARVEGAEANRLANAVLERAFVEEQAAATEEFQNEEPPEVAEKFVPAEGPIKGLTPEEALANDAAKHPNPVPGDDGDALQRIADYFIATYPEDWENIRLCPLQSGIPAMADILRGRG